MTYRYLDLFYSEYNLLSITNLTHCLILGKSIYCNRYLLNDVCLKACSSAHKPPPVSAGTKAEDL